MYWEVTNVIEDNDEPNTWHCMGWIELGGKRATTSVTYSYGEPPLLPEAEDKIELVLITRLLELAVELYEKAYPDVGEFSDNFNLEL
jgi:hypothetical protein